jgi:hypothetical protein
MSQEVKKINFYFLKFSVDTICTRNIICYKGGLASRAGGLRENLGTLGRYTSWRFIASTLQGEQCWQALSIHKTNQNKFNRSIAKVKFIQKSFWGVLKPCNPLPALLTLTERNGTENDKGNGIGKGSALVSSRGKNTRFLTLLLINEKTSDCVCESKGGVSPFTHHHR